MTAPASPPRRRAKMPWGLLVASLSLAAGAALLAADELETRARLRADLAAAEVVRSVGRRMDLYQELLRGTAALFAYDPGVDRAGFRRFEHRLRLERRPHRRPVAAALRPRVHPAAARPAVREVPDDAPRPLTRS